MTPHPRRSPQGHSFGKTEPTPPPFDERLWPLSADYLYGVDLYNFAYYWEAHEAWEGIWRTTDRRGTAGTYLQGIIQVSAALLKRVQGNERGMRGLGRAALARLEQVAGVHRIYCGVDLSEYVPRIERVLAASDLSCWAADPRIRVLPQRV